MGAIRVLLYAVHRFTFHRLTSSSAEARTENVSIRRVAAAALDHGRSSGLQSPAINRPA